jgi:hypothetical protein
MTIINFIKDLIFFIKIIFNKAEKIYFVENKKLIKYLDYYISNDLKKRNSIALISFDNFEDYYKKFNKKYIFKTNFFQQLFFLTLKAKYVITTTPDLGYTVFKKSLFAKVKYIYIQHSPFSLSHIYNKEAFINFDTIETINKQQYSDVNKINFLYKKNIQTIETDYKLFQNTEYNSKKIFKRKFLIAPTWRTNFYSEYNLDNIIEVLKDLNHDYVFRPHYMSLKKNEISKSYLNRKEFNLDYDDDMNFNEFTDLISDWSGIFIEFAYYKKKFPILINTNQKILNTEHKKYNTPVEIIAKNQISFNVNFGDYFSLKKTIILSNKNLEHQKNKVRIFFKDNFFKLNGSI